VASQQPFPSQQRVFFDRQRLDPLPPGWSFRNAVVAIPSFIFIVFPSRGRRRGVCRGVAPRPPVQSFITLTLLTAAFVEPIVGNAAVALGILCVYARWAVGWWSPGAPPLPPSLRRMTPWTVHCFFCFPGRCDSAEGNTTRAITSQGIFLSRSSFGAGVYENVQALSKSSNSRSINTKIQLPKHNNTGFA